MKQEILENKTQYQKEQDALLQTILDYRFFNPWKDLTSYYNSGRSLRLDTNLELYITSSCNQKCEYCYLQKYPEIYPPEFNKPELILHNLEILLDYLTINGYAIQQLSLFSGDIWNTEFGWKILETIKLYLDKGFKIAEIMIPSNCSFVMDDEATQKIQQYINAFREKNIPLNFSISIDGKIIDNIGRPRNDPNNIYTDEFYERVGAFAATNRFLFHPMVSSSNVKYWIKNYYWWEEFLEYYGYTEDALMLLEVRNADWTDENIEDYKRFLNFLLNRFLFYICDKDTRKFISFMTRECKEQQYRYNYMPWMLNSADTFKGCTVSNYLTVRLGDLAICPCHRTAYKQYLYGYFNVENDKITGIRAVNPELAVHILMSNTLYTTPLCDKCPIKEYCLKGCFGAQIEYGQDILFPLSNICKFFKHKIMTILKFYRENGIIDELKKIGPNEYYSATVAKLLLFNEQMGAYFDELGKI